MYSAWSGHRCFIIFVSSTLGINTPHLDCSHRFFVFLQGCMEVMCSSLCIMLGCCAVQGVVK
jgi:hypothetical protein